MSATVSGVLTRPLALTSVLLVCAAGACTFNPRIGGGGGVGGSSASGGSGFGTGGGGSTGTAPGIPGLTTLRIDPPTAMVDVQPGMPATQMFRAMGMVNGTEKDLSKSASWFVDKTGLVPSIVNGLATTGDTFGGVALVQAVIGQVSAAATFTIKFSAANVATGPGATPALPATPAQPFGGPADTARAPQLVYPNDGVLLPPNLNGVEVHFRPGSKTNTLFEIGFANDKTDVRVYTRCVTLEDGCVYRPDVAVWRQVADTNRGTNGVTITVRGTDDQGTGVGSSATARMSFSKDPLRGGLYYWTTTDKSIMRWDFASLTQTQAETVVSPADGDGSTCVGCHSMSRDGKKMVATLGGQNDGRILLWDIAKKTAMAKPFDLQRSQFESWNSAGTQFVGMYTDLFADKKPNHTGPSNLILFDGTTALKTGEIDLGGLRADHPDWSHDDQRIVFTSVDAAGSYTDQKPQKAGLAYVDKTATGWSAPMTLLPYVAGKNRYYPAIAPTNDFVVFNESTCPGGTSGGDCDADTDPTATLYALPLPPGGAAPTALARANAPGVNDAGNTVLTNTYPKWSPFIFQRDELNKVLWATFSSSRRYGLYKKTSFVYLWMFAVDANGAKDGIDPSYTAFCLPFQSLDTSNHIAQWTEKAVPIIP
jgi:hypothetical protein